MTLNPGHHIEHRLRRLLRYLEFSETAAAGVTAPNLDLNMIRIRHRHIVLLY
jgi:hypothetical protein